MITFLTKSDASEGFKQIIDFLNTSVIQYALLVNPTIYVSCIKQFWSSVSLKKTNDVVRLQALLDWRKVIITEDTVRQALRLDDVDSIDCLSNEEIFTKLARMGYEKPSTKVGKGFSGVDTPLFDGMLVTQQVQDDVIDTVEDEDATNEISVEPTPPLPTPATTPPPQQELIPSPSQQRVRRLEKRRKLKVSRFKRLRKVDTAQRVESLADIVMDDQEDASKMGGIAELDADEDVTLKEVDAEKDAKETNEVKPAEVEEVIKVVTAAKLMTEVVTTVATTAATPITATTTITVAPVPKASASRRRRGVIIQDPGEAATASLSKQRIDEEVEELKTHLQIVPNDKDDVYTEATPLALKVYVVDYQIYTEHNKPYYKIIRVDGTHQLFLSFISLLRNFDKEDLEMLWKIVQKRFESSKPKNFSDDFLLNALKTMFEKPNVEAKIWRNQRGRYYWDFTLHDDIYEITIIYRSLIHED
uniref:Xylulose kinase-1 n=1 Tax=Tanacetum cinerariifolium TaxID=118510 RepID=A0A6L2LBX5_TANCI|nr:hypothetical protein [Tanacetum cinerariifolium]